MNDEPVDEDVIYRNIEHDFDHTIKGLRVQIMILQGKIECLTEQREQTLRVYKAHGGL